MSSMKKFLGMSMMMAAIGSMAQQPHVRQIEYEPEEERKLRMKLAEQRQNEAKGLMMFTYGYGQNVWAINKKNADKKARKLNWI